MRPWKNPILVLPAIFIVFLLIFLRGAAPSVFYGDSGELQTVALRGGVAHPSGYPTFILFGQLFGRILGGDPARRITVMSSFFGAAALCALFMVLRKLRMSFGLSIAGTVIYGLSFYFWWSAIRAEVYTLAIFIFLVGMWLVLHALEKPTLPRAAAAAAGLGLSLTGHLACAPAVLVLGLMILFARPVRSRWRISWPVMALAFAAGLSPYLYLVWADAANLPVNYLDYTIELGSGQYGLTEDTFSNPFRRIAWLMTGRESRQTYLHNIRFMGRTTMQLAISLFIYQFSLLALPLFVLGGRELLKRPGKEARLLFGMLIATAVFCVVAGNRRMVMTYEWPLTIAVTVMIVCGMRSLLRACFGREAPRRSAVVSTGIAITALIVCSTHVIRFHWDRSGSIKTSMKVMLEQDPPVDSMIPDFSDYREPRIRGERIMRLLPENSLVVFRWNYMNLFYLQHVEGMRPDVELEPYNYQHFIRLRRWADTHDLAGHPIVFVGRVGGFVDDFEGLDELPIDGQESLYICRGPLSYNEDSRFIPEEGF